MRVGNENVIEYQQDVGEPIPDAEKDGVQSEIFVDGNLYIEFVDIFFDASDHPNLGDLDVVLTSPEGTESVLSEQHNEMFGVFQYNNGLFATRSRSHNFDITGIVPSANYREHGPLPRKPMPPILLPD